MFLFIYFFDPVLCCNTTLCVCIGVLRPGFMHERAGTLDCAEEIPEVVQIIPPSCCSSEQIKMFPTESLLGGFGSVTFPLVSDRPSPPGQIRGFGSCLPPLAGGRSIDLHPQSASRQGQRRPDEAQHSAIKEMRRR